MKTHNDSRKEQGSNEPYKDLFYVNQFGRLERFISRKQIQATNPIPFQISKPEVSR